MNAKRMKWAGAISVLATIATGIQGCDDDDDYPYGDDAYGYYDDAYGYYYPSDLAYSDAYYADSWYGDAAFYSTGLSLKGETATNSPGAFLRALAQGKQVCPDSMTVSTQTMPAPCSVEGGAKSLPTSVSLDFDDCTLQGGGTLNGAIEITSTQTFSDTNCDDNTVVSVSYTSTTTNLTYQAPGGARVILPTMVRSGSYTRPAGGAPASISVSTNGRLERYDADNELVAQATLNGMHTIAPNTTSSGYLVDGTLNIKDSISNQTATVTGMGLTRSDGCCYPTAGTLEVEPSDGEEGYWTFGPNCGDLSLNGSSVALDSCF